MTGSIYLLGSLRRHNVGNIVRHAKYPQWFVHHDGTLRGNSAKLGILARYVGQ